MTILLVYYFNHSFIQSFNLICHHSLFTEIVHSIRQIDIDYLNAIRFPMISIDWKCQFMSGRGKRINWIIKWKDAIKIHNYQNKVFAIFFFQWRKSNVLNEKKSILKIGWKRFEFAYQIICWKQFTLAISYIFCCVIQIFLFPLLNGEKKNVPNWCWNNKLWLI